ncbi:alpha/beta fold hydrolase [Kribbella solani]|uniref:Pimeloyl-ACP methyl ester carboxylesterase n=1 Tax=Kribbella solani TaxID=236067 RepID=A0A841DN03_9ACTN|nr:alpha/beta hydrolase [Kribbella solani]MBB5980043.1 pimeloyl-ACP methyl ester carboxylesterase [Kribbella solani]
MANLKQSELELDGRQIQYLEGGTGEPLVFLHAVGGSVPGAPFLEQLAGNFHVYAPSAPGFDGSTGAVGSIVEVADVFAAFVKQVTDQPVQLVGESFGAVCALWLAARHPEAVRNLVAVAPFAFLPPGPPPRPLPPKELALRNFGPAPAVPDGFFTPEAGQQRARNAGQGVPLLKGNDPEVFRAALGKIEAPTLVLWSTEDQQVPPALATIYQDAIPRCSATFLPDSAHSLTLSATERFVPLVADFLATGELFVASVPGESR